MTAAREIRVHGVVQGVGFRPFVLGLARANTLAGWVLNGGDGVEIHVEGSEPALDAFVQRLRTQRPPAASVTAIDIRTAEPAGLEEFTIRESTRHGAPTVRISPDLPVCETCLAELFDPAARRYLYPYINCAHCGPRYTVLRKLPYDRSRTTMQAWPLDDYCARQYGDPADRRFHAQPIACPACGPRYSLRIGGRIAARDRESVVETAALLKAGGIVAVKGLGGYHLACDARNAAAVRALRERKYRKEKPFALMAPDVEAARGLVELSAEAEALLASSARPIVLTPARVELPGVAPESGELGVMLPYTPLHHLLFAAGAPSPLVMTSANRSSEPIAYEDGEALRRIADIADAFLTGERPIARRVDDSVARAGAFGPVILRRSRGYAPGAVTTIPSSEPILALGADLKNTITLVVGGQAFVSEHIGDLEHFDCARSFRETVADLVAMYEVSWDKLIVAHDLHPQYRSTAHALELPAAGTLAVQHHRAHVASALAERQAWEKRALGVSFDGTGYGDDGSIWGGEIFAGSVAEGFERVGRLRPALLPGGDAAARYPLQAAAGFLAGMDGLPDLGAEPFRFPARYRQAVELVRKGVRTFTTTSAGRLFDAAAALLGFTREVSFEGQAAMWVERLARGSSYAGAYPFPMRAGELDFHPLLAALAEDRRRRRNPAECARAFQRGLARGLGEAIRNLCEWHGLDTAVLSGGVFQNELLLEDLQAALGGRGPVLWTNHAVPPNDGGISLGQAALAAFAKKCTSYR